MFGTPLTLTIASAATAAAAVSDLRGFRISNHLTRTLLVTGLTYHMLVGGADGLAASGLGILTGFGLTFPGYAVGGMGAGDVKLTAGLGAWLGAPLTLAVFLAAAVATGVYALALVVARGQYRNSWDELRALVHGDTPAGAVAEAARSHDRLRAVPFGAMLGIGLAALVALAWWRPGF